MINVIVVISCDSEQVQVSAMRLTEISQRGESDMTRDADRPVSEEECLRQFDDLLDALEQLAKQSGAAKAQRYHLACAHVQMGRDVLTEN